MEDFESANTGAVADPQDTPTTETTGTVEAQTTSGDDAGQTQTVVADADKSFKNDPQNKAFAEMRRQLKEQDDWAKQNFGHHGINTMAEYRVALDNQRRQEAEEEQRKKDEALLSKGYDPEVVEVMREFKNIKQERETEKRQREANQVWEGILADHASLRTKFGDLVPDATGSTAKDKVDDLLRKLDENTVGLLLRNIPLSMAWKETNEDKILEHARKSASQQTLNNVSGKAHLGTDGGGGDKLDAITVPPDTLKMYRSMFPKWSLQKIAEDYRKHNPPRR